MSAQLPVFPARLSYGASGGPDHAVEIITLASGHERRNRRRSAPRRRYVLPGTARPAAEAQALIRFFEARGGASEPFLFRDPFCNATDHQGPVAATDVLLGVGDGTTTQFTTRSVDTHGVVYPVESTLLVAVDGTSVPLGNGVVLSADGTKIVFDAPPTQDAEVTAGFEFRILVRFENTQLSVTQASNGAVQHDDIVLQEVLA